MGHDQSKLTVHNLESRKGIGHEIFHAVNTIQRDREITDEESGAWLIGYVSEFVYKFLKKKKIEVTDG
jgi:hypothetical protein